MKFLISLSYYRPHISGLSEYTKSLAEILVNAGNEVEVACCKHLTNLPTNEESGRIKIRRFMPTIRFGKGIFSMGLIFWTIRNLNRFDVLILNLPLPESAMLAILARIGKKPVISVYHCELSFEKRPVDRIAKTIKIMIDHLALRLSKFIVVNSIDYAGSVDGLRPFTKKLREIPPPIRLNFRHKLPQKTDDKSFVVGFLGRISKEKNLETLIGAIGEIRDLDIELSLAGPQTVIGEREYRKMIFEELGRLGKRVKMHGELTENGKEVFFRNIDILALPSDSRTESFGIVQVEAMAAGVPVIACDMPGVRTPILKTGAGLLVKQPRSRTEWAEKIILAHKNFNRLSRKTRGVRKYYATEDLSKRWMELLSF